VTSSRGDFVLYWPLNNSSSAPEALLNAKNAMVTELKAIKAMIARRQQLRG